MSGSPVTGQALPDPAVQATLAQLGRRSIGTHDPSTLIKCGKEYWFFGTGDGIASYHSSDLITWKHGPPIFATPPAWTKTVNEKFGHFFWAPDVIHVGDRYFVYYSISTFGSRKSAIGLVTSPTLDPDDPAYKWTDQGIVVQSSDVEEFNAIDPAVMIDHDGKMWMAFGSFWQGIKLIELDPKSGLRLPESPMRAVAFAGEIEAPAIFEHGGWYYLVVNHGLCCRGVNSTYSMHVGRSKKPDGPFVDRHGKDLLHGGGDLLLGSDGPFIGPGHAGVLVDGDRTLISMHFYDGSHNGAPTLAIRELTYSTDGWPVVGGGAK